jgi:sulfide dehydrogenase [flavocytochrome c] flavoprotein chain
MNNRRQFLAAATVGSVAAFVPFASLAATGRVVVVGGGMAGATVAKYLRLWSNKTIDVTLVEKSSVYTSNIMSNLAVTGQVSMGSLDFGYASLVRNHGIKLVTASVVGIESVSGGTWKVSVRSSTGAMSTLYADRVILAPGIQMDAVPETNNPAAAASILHAWQAGAQTSQLRSQLASMPAGGTFVMSIPPKPYRCPPGPYERACVVADYLKRNKPNSKIIVLDANPGITAEVHNFTYAFQNMYAGVLEYVPNTQVLSVNSATRTVSTSWGDFQSAVLNVIPSHRAGAVVQSVGLANSTDKPFAQVDVRTFQSVERPGLHVIGDSHRTAGVGGSGLPMAGHVGNQGAKICASAIVNAFVGKPPVDAAYLTANSACFSPLSSTQASWLSAVYHYDSLAGKMVITDNVSGTTGIATEASGPSTGNFSKMNTWFKVLMQETFA